jgi:ribonucleoside-triphosphate reductase
MEATKPFFKLMTIHKIWQVGRKMYEDFTLYPLLNGDVYFHDATKGYVPYCVGASCLDVIQNGRPYGEPISKPPKRSDSYVALCTEFLMDMSQEFAGAVAFTDFLVGLAWYTSKEFNTDKYITNRIQSFVHVANNKFRVGGDSPFSNISVNSERVTREVFDNYIFPDERTVSDFMDEIMYIQKLFVEFMYKGRPEIGGLPYKFPIITANFKKENLEDEAELQSDWFEYIARKNHKGYININTSPRFAMCCRLNIDHFKFNSFGGGGLKLGSFRVINVNLPKIALETPKNNYGQYYVRLNKAIKYSLMLLHIEKAILKEKIEQGFLKFFTMKWFDLDNMFFGTLSFHGLADSIQHFIDKDMTDIKAQMMADVIIGTFLDFAKREKDMHVNIEQAPSESATSTMVKFNKDTVSYYSNQFAPLDLPISLKERIRIEGRYSDQLTGGSMCFINVDSVMDEEQSLKLHRYIYKNSMINQWCLNYGWSICANKHLTVGEIDECNCGDTDIKHYERVVGYLVNRDKVNPAREIEMLNRVRHEQVYVYN